jgi:hypothetical protein
VKGRAGALKYVVGHIYLRHTLLWGVCGRLGRLGAKATHGAELGAERGFHGLEDDIAEIVRIRHEGRLQYKEKPIPLKYICQ